MTHLQEAYFLMKKKNRECVWAHDLSQLWIYEGAKNAKYRPPITPSHKQKPLSKTACVERISWGMRKEVIDIMMMFDQEYAFELYSSEIKAEAEA